MIQNILNLPRAVALLVSFLFRLALQNRFAKTLLKEYFPDDFYKNEKEDVLLRKTLSKAYKFAIFIPLIGEDYAFLASKKITHIKREIMTLISTIAAIYDGLLDDYHTPVRDLEAMVNQSATYKPKNIAEEVLIKIYTKLLDKAGTQKEDIRKLFIAMHHTQIASLEQTNSKITVEKVIDITKRKGLAYLVLIYILNPQMSEREKNIFIDFGSWLQMFDDMADVKQDLDHKITTLFTHPESKEKAKEFVQKFRSEVFKKVMTLLYPLESKKRFLFWFFLLCNMFYKREHGIGSANSSLKPNALEKTLQLLSSFKYVTSDLLQYDYNVPS